MLPTRHLYKMISQRVYYILMFCVTCYDTATRLISFTRMLVINGIAHSIKRNMLSPFMRIYIEGALRGTRFHGEDSTGCFYVKTCTIIKKNTVSGLYGTYCNNIMRYTQADLLHLKSIVTCA